MRAWPLAPVLLAAFLVAPADGLADTGGLGNVPVGDGSATLPIGDQPVGDREGGGCPAYPSTPVLWVDPSQETVYANGDPYTSVTDFGSDGTDLATTTNGASTPTFLDPCEDGVANNRPCASFDGGDFIRQAAANAALKFMHDGTGSTCVWVMEQVADVTGVAWANGAWLVSDIGVLTFWNATHDTLTHAPVNGSANLFGGYEPNSVSPTVGTVFSTVVQHATSNTPDWATWRDGTATDSGSYSVAPSTSNPAYPLTLGARADNNSLNRSTYRLYEIACWDSGSISVDEIHEVLTCKYGALPAAAVQTVRPPLVSASLVQPLASTTSVRSRGLRAAFSLVQQGYRPAQVIAFVADRLGVDERTAREEVRKVWGRRGSGRIDATLRTEYVGLLVPTAELPIVREVLAWTLCYPLGNCEDDESLADCRARRDSTFEPLLTQCLARERQSLGERFCSRGTSTEVGRGDRLRLTADQWAKLVEADADAPAHPGTRVIRDATDARYEQLWQNRGVERCPVEAPL